MEMTSLTSEQLLIGLNLVYITGFTIVVKASFSEFKAKLEKCVLEEACKERRVASDKLCTTTLESLQAEYETSLESLGRSLDTERARITSLIKVVNQHKHSKESGSVEGGVFI